MVHDVVNCAGRNSPKIDGVPNPGMVNNGTGASGESGLRTRSKIGPISIAMNPCAAPTSAIRMTDSTSGPVYGRTRRRQSSHQGFATASFSRACATSRGSIESMPRGLESATDSVRHGCHISGSDEPNNTTTGTPNAAAMCAGPLSLPRNKLAPASRFFTSSSDSPARPSYRQMHLSSRRDQR